MDGLLKQAAKGQGEGSVLLLCSLGRAFEAAAGCPMLSGSMPLKQQGIDVVGGVKPAVLVHYCCLASQAHRGKTVVLGNNDIPGGYPVDQGKVYTISALVENQGFCAFPVKGVGGVT